MPDSSGGVTIPKWLFGIVTSVGTVVLLGLGTWVIKTWTAPEDIATLKSEVATLKSERADEKLAAQKQLADMSQKVALMQKDLEDLVDDNKELNGLVREALSR